ncbi:MAG: hypothetical protein MUP98_04510 [Candidatus Aminicenantes bacterium]|nr:hypothetical protein [Candidatus Aminicenantes bacterium]
MSKNLVSYVIDSYEIEIFSIDKRGKRTRWGDKMITIYSEGKNVGQAVFASEGEKPPEPYYSANKIYYFAQSSQFQVVLDMLRKNKPVYFAWRPVSDPKESSDGDAVFYTDQIK